VPCLQIYVSHLLILLLLGQDQPAFRGEVALVHVDVEVREGGRLVADLGRESFRVTDEGKPQAIVYFGHEEVPLDVVLLFDARREMRPDVQRVAEAAHTALSDLRQDDRIAVMAFGVTPSECKTDLILGFTGDLAAAERSIGNPLLQTESGVKDSGFCSIQRGLASAAQLLLPQPKSGRRRAIVIITDDKGAPTRPSVVRDAIRDLWRADAVVLGVIVHSGETVVSIGPPYRRRGRTPRNDRSSAHAL
jgi:VWFA-related protein